MRHGQRCLCITLNNNHFPLEIIDRSFCWFAWSLMVFISRYLYYGIDDVCIPCEEVSIFGKQPQNKHKYAWYKCVGMSASMMKYVLILADRYYLDYKDTLNISRFKAWSILGFCLLLYLSTGYHNMLHVIFYRIQCASHNSCLSCSRVSSSQLNECIILDLEFTQSGSSRIHLHLYNVEIDDTSVIYT